MSSIPLKGPSIFTSGPPNGQPANRAFQVREGVFQSAEGSSDTPKCFTNIPNDSSNNAIETAASSVGQVGVLPEGHSGRPTTRNAEPSTPDAARDPLHRQRVAT